MIKKKKIKNNNIKPTEFFFSRSPLVQSKLQLFKSVHLCILLSAGVTRRLNHSKLIFRTAVGVCTLFFPFKLAREDAVFILGPFERKLCCDFLLPARNNQTPGRPTSPSLPVEDQENFSPRGSWQ